MNVKQRGGGVKMVWKHPRSAVQPKWRFCKAIRKFLSLSQQQKSHGSMKEVLLPSIPTAFHRWQGAVHRGCGIEQRHQCISNLSSCCQLGITRLQLCLVVEGLGGTFSMPPYQVPRNPLEATQHYPFILRNATSYPLLSTYMYWSLT